MSDDDSYVPTPGELGDEVADIIIEHFTPSPRDILQVLQKQKPGWKVPEHRIAKYMEEYTDLRRGIHKEETSAESRVPPRPPRRTLSQDSMDEDSDSSEEGEEEEEGETSRNDDDDDEELDPEDAEIEAEANRRTNFMAKAGSYSIQKVLKGEARAKKGVTRFDRRRIVAKKPAANDEDEDEDDNGDDPNHGSFESYGSYSDNMDADNDFTKDDDYDEEEAIAFAAEVERRSKFIAQGGTHSIKKVLNGEARKPKTNGPARLDRSRIQKPPKRGESGHDEPPRARQPPKTPLRNISVDSTDSQIEDEASKRSLFMLKGASHSIRKLFEGNTKKKDEGLNRIERRKMHFRKESDAVHYADKPHLKPQEINEARLKAEAETKAKAAKRKAAMKVPRRPTRTRTDPERPAAAPKKPSEPDDDSDFEYNDDDDAEFEKEIDRRTSLIQAGANSIRNLFAGETKNSSSGLNRFARRKMSLITKETEAVHYNDKPHLKPDQINARRRQEAAKLRGDAEDDNIDIGEEASKEEVDAEIERLHGDRSNDDSDDELDPEDAEIEAEADRRTNFMAKGGSYSIQKILKGEARAKKGVTRFDRRQMHFKHESEALHCHDKQEKGKAEAIQPCQNSMEESQEIVFKNQDDSTTNNGDDELFGIDADDLDAEDREIEEEADRRTNFMAKGGSYSIQKILKGEARAKKGVSRFDRRQMHFKKEAEAIHSHDHDGEMAKPAPNDRIAAPPTRKASTGDNGAKEDSDSDLDEEEKELLAQVDSRHMMMLKGASHSIRNIFAGKAKHTEPPVEGMKRRTSRLRNSSITKGDNNKRDAPPEPRVGPEVVDEDDEDDKIDDPSDSVQDDEGMDLRKRFSLKGASHSIRNLLSGKTRRNSTDMDDEIDRLQRESNGDDDMDDEDRAIEEEADRRSNFMAKGGSYSITKVLSGNARKKQTGVTRFDRRKMHFKKESEAIHSHDHDSDGKKPSGNDEEPKEAAAAEEEDDDEIEEEADRRSSFILKGASYSIQKVLSGNARKPKNSTVSRFNRKNFRKNEPKSTESTRTPQRPTGDPPVAPNATLPSRKLSDDGVEGDKDESEFDDEDAELLAQADDRTMMMLRGASHSIRNLFSGNTKMHQHDNEGTGLNRRLSRMKQSPRNSKTSSEMAALGDQADDTQGSSGVTAMEPTVSSPEAEKGSSVDAETEKQEEEEEEEEEVDFRKRFSLKGASHSIKKVLAGTARSSRSSMPNTPSQVTRLDRRKMAFRKPPSGSSDK